ncbi:Dor1-domain-containing protein [Dentipellis sp. KUC8613]|nr:Dor1-domain-containing protein [Dentipellis sp. KUC8613]
MSVELVNVLASGSTTLAKADLTSPESTSYLDELVTFPLPSLLAEPTNLSSTSSQLTNALTTLCTSSYPTFLSLHTATTGLSTTLTSFSTSLTQLLDDIPSLEDAARAFTAEVNGVQSERRRAALVLEHSTKLQDILELPVLADACVRNGYYQEALDLAAHAAALAARFPTIQVVQDVRAEADHAVRGLLVQLLGVLRAPAKLPVLFKAAGFLRKMHVLSEAELALAFLAGRREVLTLTLQALELDTKGVEREHDQEAWQRYLKRYIDSWREGVHDVVTQYTTIFLDRPASGASAPASPSASSDTLRALLPTFTTHLLTQLIDVLRAGLPHIADPTALTALLTQLTYCATSFARVGLDFRALLPPLFGDAVRDGVAASFRKASAGWCKTVKEAGKPSTWLVVPGASLAVTLETPTGPPHVPPHVLTSFPPLANYLNELLMTLNSLRLLAPADLLPALIAALDASLSEASVAFLGYARRVSDSVVEEHEGQVLDTAGSAWVRVFVPFIRRALVEGVYGAKISGGEGAVAEELQEALGEWDTWLERRSKKGEES